MFIALTFKLMEVAIRAVTSSNWIIIYDYLHSLPCSGSTPEIYIDEESSTNKIYIDKNFYQLLVISWIITCQQVYNY